MSDETLLRLLSWNIAGRERPWAELPGDCDVALLQEARPPKAWPEGLRGTTPETNGEWRLGGYERPGCAAVAWFGDAVTVEPVGMRGFDKPLDGHLSVSQQGLVAVADVTWLGEIITVVSMYAAWQSALRVREGFADASAHRILSDVAPLVTGRAIDRPMILAGDLNIFRGYGDGGKSYWKRRYDTVFDRFEAMGLPFVGPCHPNGRRASPRPEVVPEDSDTVPTFHTNKRTPATAEHQLDFVFASEVLHDRLTVRARNEPEDWGPSDHCRILIGLRSKG